VSIGAYLAVEGPIALIAISLPSIFSLVKRGVAHSPSSLFSFKDFVSTSNSEPTKKKPARNSKGFKQLTTGSTEQGQDLPVTGDSGLEYHALTLRATNSRSQEDGFVDAELAKRGIYVRQDVDVREVAGGR
jgi:hypothetical protein